MTGLYSFWRLSGTTCSSDFPASRGCSVPWLMAVFSQTSAPLLSPSCFLLCLSHGCLWRPLFCLSHEKCVQDGIGGESNAVSLPLNGCYCAREEGGYPSLAQGWPCSMLAARMDQGERKDVCLEWTQESILFGHLKALKKKIRLCPFIYKSRKIF